MREESFTRFCKSILLLKKIITLFYLLKLLNTDLLNQILSASVVF
jgi:hypothetical protein